MINMYEVNETNKMIEQENLDVRTITLGISLLDCIDSDLQQVNRKVYEKIKDLPLYIERYVDRVSEYAKEIIDIKNPGEVKRFIIDTVSKAKKSEFAQYKEDVLRTLAAIESDSIFNLFEALRSVEELFGDDIVSREYWRSKLFDMLFSRGRDEM